MRKIPESFDAILSFFKEKPKHKENKNVKTTAILPTECMQRIFQYLQEEGPNSKLYPSLQ